MKLSIKNKLIVLVLISVLVSIGGLSGIVYFKTIEMAESSFADSSLSELKQVNNFISEYMKQTQMNAKFLAIDSSITASYGKNPNLTLDKSIDYISRDMLSEEGLIIHDLFASVAKSHPAYSYVYVGMDNGGYNMYPEGSMPKGYDPRARPWYEEAMRSSDEMHVSKAYRATTGTPVSTITSKIRKNGQVIGLAAIDINLATLTNVITDIKFGKTGYVMLLEADNTILSDPVHDKYLFKQADRVESPGLDILSKLENGVEVIHLDGTEKFARVYTSPELGWKLILMVDKTEILEDVHDTLFDIAIIGLIIALALGFAGWIIARSIVIPIHLLVSAAQSVSKGEFDAIPESSKFNGELLTLQQALKNMVAELSQLIQVSEEKGLEAEEQTRLAKEALSQAEEARKKAEEAKREGMLQAAHHLEEIVGQVTSSSTELSSQIGESRSGAELQLARTTEASTAMEQMNSSVYEVAQNASKAAESADEAKIQAENGGRIVNNVIQSIVDVHSAAEEMSGGLEDLGKRAAGIGNVMNVITDIADQTNLLALNAAIEAARAGEAGRGFAVVADEVRKLAEKTMDATSEVGETVSAIQSGTQNSINDMERASEMVQNSNRYATEAGDSLSSIVGIVESTADQVRAIATASEEQSAASEEINRNTEEVNRIASQTSQAMEESTLAVDELSHLSEELQSVINGLKNV
ncbi:methyl-accepting chemotaxis protein [Marinifilum sp. JC120]|nr:methyl-accepting chemotaxis protein [Marinifilum sp. JC120]